MGTKSREEVLKAAVTLAEDIGFNRVSYRGISNRTGLKDGSIQYYFPSIEGLKSAIVRDALEYLNLKIIGQAIALEHEAVKEAPKQVLTEAVRYLRGLNNGE